jgi:N-dimethylarginine dimethylaminohydrolase
MSDSAASILMCPPTYFDVEYVINPWMEGNIGKVHSSKAREQWDALYRILSDRSRVSIVEPVPHRPDMCFTANAGLKLENIFIPTRFRVPQRAPEVPHFLDWFIQRMCR